MRKPDMVASALLFLVGLAIMGYAPVFDLGSMSVPGPGFMPFCTGILICAFSLLTFFLALSSPRGKSEGVWRSVKFQKIVLVLVALVV